MIWSPAPAVQLLPQHVAEALEQEIPQVAKGPVGLDDSRRTTGGAGRRQAEAANSEGVKDRLQPRGRWSRRCQKILRN